VIVSRASAASRTGNRVIVNGSLSISCSLPSIAVRQLRPRCSHDGHIRRTTLGKPPASAAHTQA
jgi:hypothetical protein